MTSAPSSLQERKRDVTRDAILGAAADVVLTEGVQGFSVQNVADRAGVSHRTIYRYFATRQELLDSLDAWVEERQVEQGMATPERLEEIPAFAVTLFAQYETREAFYLAASMLELGISAQSARRARTTQQVRRVFDQAFPHLTAEERHGFFGVLRHLVSIHTWQILRTQFALTGDASGPSVRRVVELMLEDLAHRDREVESQEKAGIPETARDRS